MSFASQSRKYLFLLINWRHLNWDLRWSVNPWSDSFLIYSVGFAGGNVRICTFKLGFSTVLYLPQAVHWFCYSTVISKGEIVKLNLFQTSLSCIYIVFAVVSGMICLWLLLEEVTGHFHCFFCLECFTIDSANCFLDVKIN